MFAIGDMASFSDERFGVLPGLAPVAMQQGRAAAKNILKLLSREPLEAFRYVDKGQMATIGRRKAVSEFRGLKMTGFVAWLAWLVVHIYYLIGFRTKVFVMIQWINSYVFFKRGARLITGKNWRLYRAQPTDS